MEIKIANRMIGDGHPVFFIAEAGVNHNGSLKFGKQLIDVAVAAGADAVKFQTFKSEYYVNKADVARFERLKSFELTFSEFEELSRLAHSYGLLFLSTPFDLISADFLSDIVDAYKIASGDNTFYPLILSLIHI